MSCVYIYKGHLFNSEIELDDFLSERGQYQPRLGDAVFLMTTAQAKTANAVELIREEAKKSQDKYDEWKSNPKSYWDDGLVRLWNAPRIGVTLFVQTARIGGDRMVPEFIKKEYWSRRYDDWKKKKFNKEESKLFFDDQQEEIDKFVYSDSEAERLMQMMEAKWKAQGLIGTEIHSALQIFFTGDNRLLDDTTLTNIFRSLLDSRKVPEERLGDIVKYCRALQADLVKKYGKDAVIYPELAISQKTNMNGDDVDVMGIIDLVVIDERGYAHIYDYKTSTKPYEEYSSAKKVSIAYLLAMYSRMLQRYGISTNTQQATTILPIQLVGFREEGGNYVYDEIQPGYKNPATGVYEFTEQVIDPEGAVKNLRRNLDHFLPVTPIITLTTLDLMTSTTKNMKKFFPNYKSESLDDNDIKEWMTEEDMFKKKEDGKYHFPYDSLIKADTEEELFDKVKKWKQSIVNRRQQTNLIVYHAIKTAINEGTMDVTFPKHGNMYDVNANANWLYEYLRPYVENYGDYKVLENEALLNMGIIAIENIHTHAIDILKVTDNNPKLKVKMAKGTTLMGNFVRDIMYQSDNKSRMLDAVQGNVDLMETMFVLNNLAESLQSDPEAVIGRIQLVNPHTLRSLSASNELLLYCYLELNKQEKIENDNILIENSPVRFASKWTLFYQSLCDICRRNSNKNFDFIRTCKSLIDSVADLNTDLKVKALEALIRLMDSSDSQQFNFFLSLDIVSLNNKSRSALKLYYAALTALAELKGMSLNLLLHEHDTFLDSAKILTEGWSGMVVDNPGNWKSETLNQVAKLVMEAHQNTRDDLMRDKHNLDKKVNTLKSDKGFSWLVEHTVGMQTNMYSRMTYVADNGDILCYNPDDKSVDLTDAERDFLRYFLEKINADRFYGESATNIELWKKHNDPKYYRLPLISGSKESRISTGQLMNSLKERMLRLHPKYMKEDLTKFWNTAQYTLRDVASNSNLFFLMTNEFDKSESSSRMDWIKDRGEGYFERNLETILLKHLFAYSALRNINNVFPLIKACFVHLASLGIELNTKLTKDIEFGLDYVKNKIRHESIEDPKLRPYMQVIKKFSSAASLMTLAFAPVQFGYLMLDGLWKDIALIIRKPDGHTAFTFENMRAAFTYVLGDLFKAAPTICSRLNEVYGLNDMDMNVYADKIKSDKHGIFNLWSLAFKFASRPDYYNRLTIFGAYMRADGCWDAHKLVEGLLVYDIKEDKRFDAFAKGDKSDMSRYNALKGLFIATARLFMAEHVKNADGTEYVMDLEHPSLPRAYTNQQAEGYKSLCDNLYGYYSDERKSMLHSMFLGGQYMQFRIYWSGSKNLLLEHGGVKLRGHMEQYTETRTGPDGLPQVIKYYDKVNSDGTVTITTENTGIPHYEWKGNWQEGLLVSFGDLAFGQYNADHFFGEDGRLAQFQEGELGQVHKTNLAHTYTWVCMTAIGAIIASVLADWLKELGQQSRDSEKLGDALTYTGARLMSQMLTNSFMDANLINSVGSPLGQWTPFYLEYYSKSANALWNFAFDSDYHLNKVLERTTGAGRLFAPTLDYIDTHYIHPEY